MDLLISSFPKNFFKRDSHGDSYVLNINKFICVGCKKKMGIKYNEPGTCVICKDKNCDSCIEFPLK